MINTEVLYRFIVKLRGENALLKVSPVPCVITKAKQKKLVKAATKANKLLPMPDDEDSDDTPLQYPKPNYCKRRSGSCSAT